jgi:FdhD protein
MPSVVRTSVKKVNSSGVTDATDQLAAEEPLEIRLEYGPAGKRTKKNISVTMRTPGNDTELAIGFLFTEGIIKSYRDVVATKPDKKNENIITVSLHETAVPAAVNFERNFYTTSSCGVCGKASIEAIKTVCSIPDTHDKLRVPGSLLLQLPALLRRRQELFEHTGGIHACALFDMNGTLLLSREDVGRHNAVDKLTGAALTAGMTPLDKHILLLSGRASFELVQKAIMAGIKIVAAVGAPSSLAAETAEEWGMTLIGFLRDERFNIYSGAERVVI